MSKHNKVLVRFSIIAILLGFMSPSVDIQPQKVAFTGPLNMSANISISLLHESEATPLRRTTRRTARRTSRRTVHRHSGFYRGGGYYHRGVYHPVATWSLVTLSALAVGSIISSSSMSSSCMSQVVNGITYKNCDGTYFEPYYDGDSLEYKVVASPL
jgi:hypothetical protein